MAKAAGPKKKKAKKPAPRRDLTPRQRRFVQEFGIDLNGTQAAIRAGYSQRTARQQAARLLSNVNVQAAIAETERGRAVAAGVDAESVLRELKRIGFVDLGGAYDEDGALLPIHEIPEDIRRAIAGIEVFEEFEGRGEDREQIGITRKVRMADKLGALKMLGQHLKLFTDKVEHGGTVTLKPDLSGLSTEELRALAGGAK